MKKILALVLAVLVIMAMTIPAFAVEEDAAPCAVICTTHTKGTYQGPGSYWEYGDTTICNFVTTKIYECSVCHKIFSEDQNRTALEHDATVKSATCNGTTQTWVNYCSQCKKTYSTPNACPRPGHIAGNCNWLPV